MFSSKKHFPMFQESCIALQRSSLVRHTYIYIVYCTYFTQTRGVYNMITHRLSRLSNPEKKSSVSSRSLNPARLLEKCTDEGRAGGVFKPRHFNNPIGQQVNLPAQLQTSVYLSPYTGKWNRRILSISGPVDQSLRSKF